MGALRRPLVAAAALAALIALILVLTQGSSPPRGGTPPGESQPSQIQFGVNVGSLFNGNLYPPAAIAAQLAALRLTGATLARADAPWEASEPQRPRAGAHRYDWRFDDRIASALAAHGLNWLPVIDYSAPWAQSVPGQDHSPPSSPADYAAYAAAFAGRYGPGGSFWSSHPGLPQHPVGTYEIWNEPDSPDFWYPTPDPARYDALFMAARAAIKAAQPAARVIVGGLAHPSSSIPALIGAMPSVAHVLDGVAIHPYGPTPAAVVQNVRGARAALGALGLSGVPLYVTEFGWSTSPPGGFDYLPESLRADYIEQTLGELGHLDCGLAAVLLYAWTTPQRDRSNSGDWFGISPPDGGQSADVRAFVQGLHAATAPATPIPCG